MKAIVILICALLTNPNLFANTYFYPKDKKPLISLKEADDIAEKIIKQLGVDGYYALAANLLGDEEQTGAGAWALNYSNSKGKEIQITLYFPEDLVLYFGPTKEKEFTELGYTRDGKISQKWLDHKNMMEEEMKKDREFWDSLAEPDIRKSTKPEQAAPSNR